MNTLAESHEQNLAQQELDRKNAIIDEEEAKKAAKKQALEALKDATWLQPSESGGESQNDEIEAPEQAEGEEQDGYDIDPDLVQVAPEYGTKTIGWEIGDINDKEEIAEKMAIMKQIVPEGTEIGVRVDPETGGAEIYAETTDMSFEEIEQKMSDIMGFEVKGMREKATRTAAYEDAKTPLSKEEQKALVANANEAMEIVEGMEGDYKNTTEIRAYITSQKDSESPAQGEAKSDLATIGDTLKNAGLGEIALDQQVATVASKPQQAKGDFTPPR